MKRMRDFLGLIGKGISVATTRFPLTVISLAGATALICRMIWLQGSMPLLLEKLVFTFLVAAILAMAAQFAMERFDRLRRLRLVMYGISALLSAGYLLILWPAPEISPEIGVRTVVTVFALICAVLWLPSVHRKTDFNRIALIHFKSVFTSVLYAAVLSAGISAILAAVNILLFPVSSTAYAYTMAIVWIMFATVYYLSLLPKFNSGQEWDVETLVRAGKYPKFLEILVSYIAIPLMAAYTVVLFAYFVKILIAFKWPTGQLGPMVLAYSAVGIFLFVLSSLLENRFAVLYRRVFPKVLVPVVVMQLISVGIRLNAYGVTESRYYLALFGIFSIIIGILLSIRPVSRNGIIALLAAVFAIFSITPPLDAFTVSRLSQINRIEKILQAEGILTDDKLTPKSDASQHTMIESTNILSYLDGRGQLAYLDWLPSDFNVSQDMESSLGFGPTFSTSVGEETKYFYASLDPQAPVNISGYDVSVYLYSGRYENGNAISPIHFSVRGNEYELSVERLSNLEARVSVKSQEGAELIATGLYEFANNLSDGSRISKDAMPLEKMTLDVTENDCKLRIIFQSISATSEGSDRGADYAVTVLFGAP